MSIIARSSYSIYRMIDPRDNLIYYVGLTACMEQRLAQHLYGDSSRNDEKDNWLAELDSLGLQPIMEEIEFVRGPVEEARQREIYWIRRYDSEGMPLTNSKGFIPEATEKTTLYLSPRQSDKLDDLTMSYKRRTGKRITRNMLLRKLIDRATLDDIL